MSERSITGTIDEVLKIAPDLDAHLAPIRYSAIYTAPELMPDRWVELSEALIKHATYHIRRSDISAIVKGES